MEYAFLPLNESKYYIEYVQSRSRSCDFGTQKTSTPVYGAGDGGFVFVTKRSGTINFKALSKQHIYTRQREYSVDPATQNACKCREATFLRMRQAARCIDVPEVIVAFGMWVLNGFRPQRLDLRACRQHSHRYSPLVAWSRGRD